MWYVVWWERNLLHLQKPISIINQFSWFQCVFSHLKIAEVSRQKQKVNWRGSHIDLVGLSLLVSGRNSNPTYFKLHCSWFVIYLSLESICTRFRMCVAGSIVHSLSLCITSLSSFQFCYCYHRFDCAGEWVRTSIIIIGFFVI